MNPILSPYVLIMITAAMICMFNAAYVWPRRRNNSETIPLILLLSGITEWIAAALLGLLDQNLAHKILWAKIEYIGVVSVPLAVLGYVLHHSGSKQQLTGKRLAWLALIPVATLILAWTNESHGLIWAKYIPYRENGLVLSDKIYGLGFWVYWVYSYMILLVATVLTIRLMLVSAKIFRWQSIVIVIGILMPWAGNLLYVLHINPFMNLDLTPLAFGITGILLATGMFRWRLFDIKPIAQAAVIAGMADGLMILDNQGRIVDVNPAAQVILDLEMQEMVGKHMEQIIPSWQPLGERSDRMNGQSIEIKLKSGRENRDYELSDSPFYEKQGSLGGIIIILHDVTERNGLEEQLRETERKHAEVLLQQSKNKYAILYQNMSVGVIYQSVDGKVIDMNPAAERILGAGLAQIGDLVSIRANLKTVHEDGSDFPPEEHPSMVSLNTGMALRDQLMGVYFPNEKNYHWININTVPQFKPREEKPYQVFVTFDDITERKRAEQEIRRRLTDLNVLYESSLALSSQLTPQETGRMVIEILKENLDWHHAVIRIRREESDELEIIAYSAPSVNQENYTAEIDRLNNLVGRIGQGMSGWVLQHGEGVRSGDLPSDPRYVETYASISSGLYAPMIAGEEVIGVIGIESEIANAFNDHDERLLATLSKITANAIHRSRLSEQTEFQLQRLAALRSIDQAISTSFDLRLTLDVFLRNAVAQLGADAALILLVNPTMKTLEYAAEYGFHSSAVKKIQLRLGEGDIRRIIMDRQVMSIPKFHQADRPFLHPELAASENFVSCHAGPLIAKGQVKGVLEVFLRTLLEPKTEWLDFLETLAGQAAIAIENNQLFENLERSNFELAIAYDETIEGWSRAMDLRDQETEGHTKRVTEMTLRVANDMGFSAEEMLQIRRGALLHDIGKMGVSDNILRKPGALTDKEWESMRKHPQFAYEMLLPITYLRSALDIPYCHHEKWDGSGYPRGLKGEEIPLAARIFTLPDVWDALTSDRPYRKAWSQEKVLEYMQEQSGKHFDPGLMSMFLKKVVNI